jgi:hypothetical protein
VSVGAIQRARDGSAADNPNSAQLAEALGEDAGWGRERERVGA